MQENITELTDEYIIGDMLHSARVFLIIGIVILIMVIVVFAFKKKINMPFSRIAFLFIFGILLAGGAIFIGVRTLLGLKDFTVIETVVTDKKCVEEYDPTGTKKNGKKKTTDKYYVYFENGFPPDTSGSGYAAANIGDHVYIANINKSGATQYYYGDSYLYTGSHLEKEKE